MGRRRSGGRVIATTAPADHAGGRDGNRAGGEPPALYRLTIGGVRRTG
jgi:hypothetical protein